MEELDPKYKQEGFKVPENYFDNLESQVFRKINPLKAQPVLSVWKRKTTWLAAASVALIAGVTYISFNTQPPSDYGSDISFENIESSELLAYANDVDISDDEFEDFLPATAIDSIYNAEIVPQNQTTFDPADLQDLEEEYSPLDTDTDYNL
jgi:hypothetical protein